MINRFVNRQWGICLECTIDKVPKNMSSHYHFGELLMTFRILVVTFFESVGKKVVDIMRGTREPSSSVA